MCCQQRDASNEIFYKVTKYPRKCVRTRYAFPSRALIHLSVARSLISILGNFADETGGGSSQREIFYFDEGVA